MCKNERIEGVDEGICGGGGSDMLR